MNKEEFLKMFENVVNWCNESPGRSIFSVSYNPSCQYVRPYILISEDNVGCGTVREFTANIDLPALIKANKLKELEKLQGKLNAN